MNRDGLCIKEVELFKATVRWVSVESERQGFHLNFGRIVKLISFPLMSQKDFMSHVPDSNNLTSDEIIDLMKQFNGVPLQNPLPFFTNSKKRNYQRLIENRETWGLRAYHPRSIGSVIHEVSRQNPRGISVSAIMAKSRLFVTECKI